MRFFFGFVLGLALGSFLALIATPQPGSQTRRLLAEQTRQRAEQARQQAARVRQRLPEARMVASEFTEQARQQATRLRQRLQQRGWRKYRQSA